MRDDARQDQSLRRFPSTGMRSRAISPEKAPRQESERIGQWLDEHKADAELCAALDNAMSWLALHGDAGIDVEAALASVAARRDAPQDAQVERLQPTSAQTLVSSAELSSPWRAVAFLAAAAAIVVAARLVLYRPEW